MKLITGGKFFGGFDKEVREEAEKRKIWEEEQAAAMAVWTKSMLAKGFLNASYGVMYNPETREAYQWRGGAEGGPEPVPYTFRKGGLFPLGLETFQRGGVFTRPTVIKALVGEGGEPEILSPESLMRKVVREETRGTSSGGGDVQIGTLNLEFPNVRNLADLKSMSPIQWKEVLDRGLLPGMKMVAREGKLSKESVMMN